jgi:hypothetical protein
MTEDRDKLFKELDIPKKYKELNKLWGEFEVKLAKWQDTLIEKDFTTKEYNSLFQSELIFFIIKSVGEEGILPFLISLLNNTSNYIYEKTNLQEKLKERFKKVSKGNKKFLDGEEKEKKGYIE